jgi:hypothetical protein
MSTTLAAPTNLALANTTPAATAMSPNVAPPMRANSVPDNSPGAAFAPPDQTAMQTVSNDSAADDLPARRPLSGKIPLPQHRPHAPATAIGAPVSPATAAAHVALAAERAPAGVPLPRARPAAAPEPTPVEPSHPAYDPSQIH